MPDIINCKMGNNAALVQIDTVRSRAKKTGGRKMGELDNLSNLAELSFLDGMPDEMKAKIVEAFGAVGEPIDLGSGEDLMHEGHLGFEAGYVLLKGAVQIEKEGNVLADVPAPALLGEMSQFKSGDTRTATVTAKGELSALAFDWGELYERLKQTLSDEQYALFMKAIEQLVWERFDCKNLLNIALFRSLNDEIKLKICSVFPWITERRKLAQGATLFEQGDYCQGTGYLLVKGSFKLKRGSATDAMVAAPNIIGIIPQNDPSLKWTATAIALDSVEVLIFSWEAYLMMLKRQISHDERELVKGSMKENSKEHLWH